MGLAHIDVNAHTHSSTRIFQNQRLLPNKTFLSCAFHAHVRPAHIKFDLSHLFTSNRSYKYTFGVSCSLTRLTSGLRHTLARIHSHRVCTFLASNSASILSVLSYGIGIACYALAQARAHTHAHIYGTHFAAPFCVLNSADAAHLSTSVVLFENSASVTVLYWAENQPLCLYRRRRRDSRNRIARALRGIGL